MRALSEKKLTSIPQIDLGDLLLRRIEPNDYKDVYDYGKDPEVTKHLTWDYYKSEDEAIFAIKRVFLQRPKMQLPAAHAIIHKQDNKMIGTCDFCFVDWEKREGEIGYVLHKSYWNKGYMTRVLCAVMEFGYRYLKLKTIIIRHLPDNKASQRVIEKCGFLRIEDSFHEPTNQLVPTYKLTKRDFFHWKKGRK
jgi:ribosomal-protein-alanine N-acetyltransferase